MAGRILSLAGSSALTGAGLILVGASRLGWPIAETTGLHVVTMGGLGLGVLSVFCIAGLMHTRRTLPFGRLAKVALLVLVLAMVLRVAPDLGWIMLPGPVHGLASLAWASALLIWLAAYWPLISDRTSLGAPTC